MDAAAAKAILERFPYGLYVATVRAEGEDYGVTANWITQASFDPPMIAVSIENTSTTIRLIRDAHHFAVSLLTTEQRELAGKLGRTLKGVKTKPAPTAQTPVLTEAVGWVECRVVATLPAGDHTLVLGEVLEAGVENGDAEPLTLKAAGFKYG